MADVEDGGGDARFEGEGGCDVADSFGSRASEIVGRSSLGGGKGGSFRGGVECLDPESGCENCREWEVNVAIGRQSSGFVDAAIASAALLEAKSVTRAAD